MREVIGALLTALLSVTAFTALPLARDWKPGTTVYPYHAPKQGGVEHQRTTVIGRAWSHRVGEDESLLDIARHYHLGYQEIVQANPGVDPWVPPVGREIHIPAAWILPRGERRGLVLNIPEMRLYFYLSESEVMTFPLGIGMEGWETPAGRYWIGEKRTNPVWHVPRSIQKEMEVPRKVVLPGPDNPLGSHWMRLSRTSYGIHGTNNPWAVGRYVTHGCIRLYPEDIAFLYPRVAPRTPVQVIYRYAKVGIKDGKAFFQVSRYRGREEGALLADLIRQFLALEVAADLRRVRRLLRSAPDGALIEVPLR